MTTTRWSPRIATATIGPRQGRSDRARALGAQRRVTLAALADAFAVRHFATTTAMALRRALRMQAFTRPVSTISMSVMRDGTRYAVEGKVGETLAKALSRHPALASAVPVTSIARGPDAHVLIPDEHLAKMPELEYLERDQLEDVGIDPGANSRLASQCMLTPELDGLVVSMGAMYPENPM